MFSPACKKRKAPDGNDDLELTRFGRKPRIEDALVRSHLKTVLEAVANLPNETPWSQQLLLNLAEASLVPSASQRQHIQTECVALLSGALKKQQERLEERARELGETILNSPKEERRLTEARDEALGQRDCARERRESLETALAEVQSALAGAQTRLEEATIVFERSQKLNSELLQEREQQLQAFQTHFMPLASWEFPQGDPGIQAHLDALLPTLERPGFDADLLAALPLSVRSHPAQRGRFGSMTVKYMGDLLQDGLHQVEQQLADLSPDLAKQEQAVEAASTDLSLAQQAERDAVQALEDAQAAEEIAEQQRAIAEAVLQAFPGQIQEAQDEQREVQASLVAFEEGPLSAFKWLRDRD